MIKISNLSKSFYSSWEKIEIFDNLNFEIGEWEFIAVMGTSGSGKTTFLNMLAWLDRYNSWSIKIDWNNLENLNSDQLTLFRWSHISFIFQQFNLIPNLTCAENIDLVIDINKIPRQFETLEILKKVWLENKYNQYPFNLSGWEQQRVVICRAFVGKTKLILADEPTWNLDTNNSKKIMELISQLHSDTNNTIVMITHDLNIAKYADKIYILEDKKFKLYD